MRDIRLDHTKKLNLFADMSEEFPSRIESYSETIKYQEHYRDVIHEIHNEYYKAMNEGYTPEKLLLGVEAYKRLMSVMSYENHGVVMPTEFLNMEIVLRDSGYYEYSIEVVCSIRDEISRAYWRKNK
ncbi:hypothetical protein ABE236_18265 [Priestia endophytica]|uniref:hypothetical protein n=1 Tax=Priestia endophytica TaxID=135735 RepID=UPI003D27DBDB